MFILDYLFKEDEKTKQERLLRKQNDFNLKLLNIQNEFQSWEHFTNIGVEEFNSRRVNLQFVINLLVEQTETDKVCKTTKEEARRRIVHMIKIVDEIDKNATLQLGVKDDWTSMKTVLESLKNALHQLNSQLSLNDISEYPNFENLTYKMTDFDIAADNFTIWFENMKESKKPEILKGFQNSEDYNDLNLPDSSPCDTLSDVERKVEIISNDIKRKYRTRDGKIDLKDIAESNMKIHECWKKYAKGLEKDMTGLKEEVKYHKLNIQQIEYPSKDKEETPSPSTSLETMKNYSLNTFLPYILVFFLLFFYTGQFYNSFYWTCITIVTKGVWTYFSDVAFVFSSIKEVIIYCQSVVYGVYIYFRKLIGGSATSANRDRHIQRKKTK